jgi:predicted ATPase
LAEDGYRLATWLDAFADAAPRRFEQIEEVLRNLVPGIDRVTFPTLPNGYKSIMFHEKWGAKVHATEASDGLLLFLAYLGIAYAHPDVGVLLLEEPETGVHPLRLGDIVRLLRGISRGETGLPPVQVIATSHSPYLLDWCSKEEVIFFDRDEAGNIRTKPLSEVPEIDDRIEDFESLGAFIYAAGETLCKSPS